MPTAYDGLYTNTQAPASAPEPEGTCKVNLPADADPPNASTYIQAYKVLADFIDFFLKGPKAKIATTAAEWARSIFKFRAANGHTRSRIDHLGFRMGRVVRWEEDWSRGLDITGSIISGALGTAHDFTGVPMAYDVTVATKLVLAAAALNNSAGAAKNLADISADLTLASGGTLGDTQAALALAASNANAAAVNVNSAASNIALAAAALVALTQQSPWKKRVVQTTGLSGISFVGPDTAHPRHRYALLYAGETTGDLALLWRKAPTLWDQGLHIAMEWEAQLSAASTSKTELAAGLCREDGTHFGASQASDYAVFVAAPGVGNWSFQRRSASGAVVVIDTGVPLTANLTRFRLELHGATVAEDTNRSIRAYIDGTRVVDVNTSVPVATVEAAPHFATINTVGGAGGATMLVAAPRLGHNLYPSDVQ